VAVEHRERYAYLRVGHRLAVDQCADVERQTFECISGLDDLDDVAALGCGYFRGRLGFFDWSRLGLCLRGGRCCGEFFGLLDRRFGLRFGDLSCPGRVVCGRLSVVAGRHAANDSAAVRWACLHC
jgi:hypothetical protein